MRLVDFLLNLPGKDLDKTLVSAIRTALAKVSDEDALGYIVRASVSASDQLRPVLAEVIRAVKTEEAFKALLSLLKDKDALTVREAAKSIAKRQDSRAVDSLIDALALWEGKDKDAAADLRNALVASTGKSGEGLETAQDWRNFWINSNRKTPEEQPESSRKGTPSFFGTTLSSMRFVFIIDISGSMNLIDPSKDSGGDADSEGKTTPTEQAEKISAQEKTRLGRTKRELINVISAISKDAKFNIIAFNHEIKSWKPDMVDASDENKQAAIEFVRGLAADGLTHTDDALREAFKNKDADTFILLSDGAPTHEGGEGREDWDGHKDSKEIIERIYKEIEELNRTRQVRIDTFGFPSANLEFMRKLAERNGGIFNEIK
jgi:hypothetical protein